MPFLPPNQQRQSTDTGHINRYTYFTDSQTRRQIYILHRQAYRQIYILDTQIYVLDTHTDRYTYFTDRQSGYWRLFVVVVNKQVKKC